MATVRPRGLVAGHPFATDQGWHGPGLGVDLDRDMLGRLHDNHLRCGVRVRDTAYMQRFDPPFRRLRPRW